MRRKLSLLLSAACLVCTLASAQPKEVHIISTNDMHANIQAFPQLAAIVDSMRAVHPGLLVISAGDNRTGEPLNDLYEIPAYPMVALMNQVGFDLTTLGNHEFDSGQAGLARLISLSNFDYVCANVHPDPKWGMHLLPYKMLFVDGVKVGVVGAVQLGTAGHPDSHPDNCVDITFTPVLETVQQYKWLRDQCDVVIFLSHLGYDDDVKISADLPWVDLIIGGHSHTQVKGGEIHNGVMITQDSNKLKNVTHTTLTVENGRVTGRKAELINVTNFPAKNKIVEELTRYFCDNPAFERVLCQLEKPVSAYEELGCLMTDAWRAETGSDVAFTNAGGIRFDSLPAGPFTVSDVLRLDPFGNEAVELTLTGKELKEMLIACANADEFRFPSVSGIVCNVVRDKKRPETIKDVVITFPDGVKFDLKRLYKVVTNSYSAAIADSPRQDQGHGLNRTTASLIQDYLEHQGRVDYAGKCRIFETKK